MHEKYSGGSGLEIVGFPCNQFMKQEPWDNAKIHEFTREKFDISFPLMQKCDVNGKHTHPVFKFLRAHSDLYKPIKGTAKEVPWNFAKFILDSEGAVRKYVDPQIFIDAEEEEIVAILEEEGNGGV